MIDPITALKLGLTVKKWWKVGLYGFIIILFLPLILMFMMLPQREPTDVEVYKSIAAELKINWVEPLIIDMVRYDNNFEGITNDDVLNSCLDFMSLRVDIYRYSEKREKWVYSKTVYYYGSSEIKSFIRKNDGGTGSAKSIMSTLDSLNRSPEYKINISYLSFEDMIEKYKFDDEKKNWATEILASNMIQQMYGEYIELPDHIEVTSSGFFAWPVPTLHTVTSPYGWRSDPFTGERVFHLGNDISGSGAMGQPIIASAPGTVIQVNYDTSSTYGYFVKMEHHDDEGNTWFTRYAHMSAISVNTGDVLERGDVLGAVGNTGYSTGPHLHFEIYFEGNTVNSLDYVSD